jgi:hypothetical protein
MFFVLMLVSVILTLKQKPPFGFWMAMLVGAGSRLVYFPHNEPEVFLKEINGAWDRWRLTHGEAESAAESKSSPPAAPAAPTNSRVA